MYNIHISTNYLCLNPPGGLLIILRIKLLQVKDWQQRALEGSEVPQHHTCHGRGVLDQSGVQQDHGNFPQALRFNYLREQL